MGGGLLLTAPSQLWEGGLCQKIGFIFSFEDWINVYLRLLICQKLLFIIFLEWN